MVKKTSEVKKQKEVQEELEQAFKIIRKHSSDTLILANVEGAGLWNCIDLHGNGKDKSAYDTFRNMIMTAMIFAVKHKNPEYEQEITQGKVDFAYCMTLDILHTLLRIGATDFADIHEEIENDGEDWLDADDIEDANNDENVVFDPEDDEDTTIVAPRDEEELKEVLAEIFGDKKTKKAVHCFTKKLSKEEMAKLKTVLDEIEGEVED